MLDDLRVNRLGCGERPTLTRLALYDFRDLRGEFFTNPAIHFCFQLGPISQWHDEDLCGALTVANVLILSPVRGKSTSLNGNNFFEMILTPAVPSRLSRAVALAPKVPTLLPLDDRLQSSIFDRLHQDLVVAFALICVGDGEVCDRPVSGGFSRPRRRICGLDTRSTEIKIADHPPMMQK